MLWKIIYFRLQFGKDFENETKISTGIVTPPSRPPSFTKELYCSLKRSKSAKSKYWNIKGTGVNRDMLFKSDKGSYYRNT